MGEVATMKKRVLGRGLGDLAAERSTVAAIHGDYDRETAVKRLLPNLTFPVTEFQLVEGRRETEMQIAICQMLICAYLDELENTDTGLIPRLQKLRQAVEAETKHRDLLMSHQKVTEHQARESAKRERT